MAQFLEEENGMIDECVNMRVKFLLWNGYFQIQIMLEGIDAAIRLFEMTLKILELNLKICWYIFTFQQFENTKSDSPSQNSQRSIDDDGMETISLEKIDEQTNYGQNCRTSFRISPVNKFNHLKIFYYKMKMNFSAYFLIWLTQFLTFSSEILCWFIYLFVPTF
jgi:hypothetical protein